MGFITLPQVQLRFLDPADHMKFMHICRVLGEKHFPPGPQKKTCFIWDLVSRDVFRWIRGETKRKTEVLGSILDVYVSENSLG